MVLTTDEIAILDIDYPITETTREDVDFYMKYQSRGGDMRLARGLIRTEAEEREFIERGLAIKLPGCR